MLPDRDFLLVVVTLTGYGLLRVHRIIWKMEFGTEPEEIDHKDCNPWNNSIDNLRECTRSQNLGNRRGRAISGFKGVKANGSGWCANICVRGKQTYLGTYRTKGEAHAAYAAAAREAFGEFARAA